VLLNNNYIDKIFYVCGNVIQPKMSSPFYIFIRSHCYVSPFYTVSYPLLFAGCGGTFREKEGYLFSPGFPSNYASNLTCDYTLEADDNQFVVLHFDEHAFNIERKIPITKFSLS